jgi:hypothetical protein
MLESNAKRLPCGCEIVGVLNGTVCVDHILELCPLHAAAPEMLEALKDARVHLEYGPGGGFKSVLDDIIAKVEGRGI